MRDTATRNHVLNQAPVESAVERQQPMHHVSKGYDLDGYFIKEIPKGHLILRSSHTNTQFLAAIEAVTGLQLPLKPLSSVENDAYTISWISVDEWLLLVPALQEHNVETLIREQARGHFAVVNVTGGQTLLELSGQQAEIILNKSTVYNVSIKNFPLSKVVNSTFAKSQACIRRKAEDHFQLIVRRSFSDYLWKWLVDAESRS